MNIQYIKDTDVTDLLDKQIRLLLSSCFTNEQDADIFSRQRFYNEMPQHRYLLWQQEDLIGHIAVHDKKILIDDVEYSISGIAEVCIAPKWRRHGYVKAMLKKVHQDRIKCGDAYAILFGESEIYASSDYRVVNNLKVLNHNQEWQVTGHTMVHDLTKNWPTNCVKLIGIPF